MEISTYFQKAMYLDQSPAAADYFEECTTSLFVSDSLQSWIEVYSTPPQAGAEDVAPGTTDKAQSLDPTHKNLVTNGDVSRQIRYGEAKSEQLGIIIESDLNLQKATLPEDLRRFVVVMFGILGTIVLHV
jgi:hypothetical protein